MDAGLARDMVTPMSAFAAWLQQRLKDQGESISGFARKVGTAHSFISHVMRDERRPPLDQLEKWADALEIPEQGRPEFRELAHLAHAPDMVQDLVTSLRRKVEQTQQNQRLILQELARRGIRVEGLHDDV